MNYIHFNQGYEKELVALWNKCLPYDQIGIEEFRNKAILDDNFDVNLTWLAIEKEQLVGFIMATKRKFPYMERGLEPERGWINVMFVDPDYQRKGIGETLYKKTEEALRELGTKEITLAMYSPNYFFGGLDEENYPAAESFFKKMGYIGKEQHYSMEIDLTNFKMSEAILKKKKNLEEKGYTFTRFDYSHSLEMIEFLKKEFGGGWKRNALLSMRAKTAEDLIIMVLNKKGRICGFSISDTDGNPERFGPIGVAEELRNEGIGSVLLNYSFECIANRGIKRIYFKTTDEPGKRYYIRNGLSVIKVMRNYRKAL